MAKPYLAGTDVDVRYNPKNPADAVLEDRAAHMGTMLIIGIVVSLIGVCGAIVLNFIIH